MIIHVKEDKLHIDLPSLQNDLNQIGMNAINGFMQQQNGDISQQVPINNPAVINIHGEVYDLDEKDLNIIQWLMQYKNINPTQYYDHMQQIFNDIFDQTSRILRAKDEAVELKKGDIVKEKLDIINDKKK